MMLNAFYSKTYHQNNWSDEYITLIEKTENLTLYINNPSPIATKLSAALINAGAVKPRTP